MGVHCTCGEPDEIKKNTHPKYITALVRDQAARLKRHAEEQREQQERERRLSEFNPSSKVVRETPQSSTSAFATRAPANFDLLANTMDRIRGGGASQKER